MGVNKQPLCIIFHEAKNFELKSRLIHLLPTFRDLENEYSHKFLKEYHVVCSKIKPHAINEDQIKLGAFPLFSSRLDERVSIRSTIKLHNYLEQACETFSIKILP